MNTSLITEDLGSLWVLLKTVYVEGKEPKTYLSIVILCCSQGVFYVVYANLYKLQKLYFCWEDVHNDFK